MTSIIIEVEPVRDRSLARVVVEDDSPVGFRDLSHAYTIFAESYKRGNPELRGQFNFGEKQFLSLCRTATISTTTGTVVFDDEGRHEHTRKPYSNDPDAPTVQFMDRKDWTPGMVRFHDYLCWVAAEVLGVSRLTVRYPLMMGTIACYGRKSDTSGTIDFNVGDLGIPWFDSIGTEQDELATHEFAHHRAGNHYSEEFHQACCEVGAGLKKLAMSQPERMAEFVMAKEKDTEACSPEFRG
jgi:hypothetical protein